MTSSALPDPVDVPPEHAFLVVDMKGYSQIPEAEMAPVRSDLDSVLTTVFAQSGLTPVRPEEDHYKETGDGAIFVLPARDAARLIDLLSHLNDALVRRHKARLADSPPIRLRASVHTGPLVMPGYRGDAINDACRFVDSQAVRQAMTAALEHGSFLAAVISEIAFRRTVRAGRTLTLDERQFLVSTARVQGKPDFEEPCRVFVPRVPPALVSPYITEESDVPPPHLRDPAAQAPAGSRKTGERSAPVRQKARASGHAQVVQVGGDQITYRPEQP
ncbi:hypothetical protein [Streptomyces pini]|uniref:Guanylate cyclase domain-containing protein n=1 Tax=Streptomyces pini TaxID=1520580 RepID=A0A1I4JPP2_9ACTN|nr:hypothetical protein [Streptomyces pini]SFL68167.1 hypothetical protein SAMN05192584_12432 [Streptomyces pini]